MCSNKVNEINNKNIESGVYICDRMEEDGLEEISSSGSIALCAYSMGQLPLSTSPSPPKSTLSPRELYSLHCQPSQLFIIHSLC